MPSLRNSYILTAQIFPFTSPFLSPHVAEATCKKDPTKISTQPGSALYPHKEEKKPPPSHKGTRILSLRELVLPPQAALTRMLMEAQEV